MHINLAYDEFLSPYTLTTNMVDIDVLEIYFLYSIYIHTT